MPLWKHCYDLIMNLGAICRVPPELLDAGYIAHELVRFHSTVRVNDVT